MANNQNIFIRPPLLGSRFNRIILLIGITGPVILVIANIITALSAPGYSFISDSISSLAWTRLGWVQTAGFLITALLTEVFAVDLFLSVRTVRGFRLGAAVMAFSGLFLIIIGVFHTDPSKSIHTTEGMIHAVASQTIFWLFPLESMLMTFSLRKDRYWKHFFIYSILAVALAAGVLIPNILISGNNAFGLFERILVGDELLWTEIIAIWVFRLSMKRRLINVHQQ